MSHLQAFAAAFARCPLIAILRGIRPDEVDAIGDALVDAGFEIIEVPLNSPDPLNSIKRLAVRLDGRAIVGAGTVLTPDQASDVAAAGGKIIVSPNTNPSVIARTSDLGMVSLPGCYTPTDAFAALAAGAHGLKFFPADAIGPNAIKGLRAVLPKSAPLLAVGGISVSNIANWKTIGIDGFGLGSALYSPGAAANKVRTSARGFIEALHAC